MFEFLFNYSYQVFDRGELILASDWPVSALIVSVVVMALVIAGLLIRQRKMLPWPRLLGIGLLQLTMLALVLAIIWQPALHTERLRAGDNVVAVMLDTSASMTYGTDDASRMQQARSSLSDDLLERLANEYTVQHFVFAGQSSPVESFDELPAPVAETKLADSLLRVLRQARSTPLGAVILVSDGADNAGALAPNQLAEIEGFGVPIHVIGIGRERIPEDVELQDVLLPGKALPGTKLSARLTIRHDAEGSVRVKVYDGETFVTSKEIPLPGGATTVTTAYIDFALSEPGYRDLRFSLDRLSAERHVGNNTRNRVVEVPDDSYRILYIEGEPRWEYKFLRRALEQDRGIRLVSLLRVSPNKFYRQGIDDPDELADGFPLDKASLYKYQALIIGNIEAAMFTPGQQGNIRDFVSLRGGSLMLLAGTTGLGAGGWGNSTVGGVLPARLSAANAGFVREQVPAVVTALGAQTSMLKFSEDATDNADLWRQLPAIADYQNIGTLKPAAVTLLQLSVGGRLQPLLVTQRYGRGQSYILATSGTWRWQMSLPVVDQRHETFWRQLARGLVVTAPEQFELSTVSAGDTITIHAEVRNADFEPETAVEVTAVVSPESGEPLLVELRPSPEQPGVFEGEFAAVEPGLHVIEAIARHGADEPAVTARVAMHPETSRAEAFSLRQNRALLEGLAATTGGQYWTLDQLQGLPEAIRYSAAGITEHEIRPLWDAPAIFLLLLLLKAFEWLLRRRWRKI